MDSPGRQLEVLRIHDVDGLSSGESTDELIEEAESFLAAVERGKEDLVTVEDWTLRSSDKKVRGVMNLVTAGSGYGIITCCVS